MKDSRRPQRRGRRSREEVPTFDIVTPTPDQAHLERLAIRQRRYFRVMIPCILLASFGFFIPAPKPMRLVALAIASVLPPIGAIVGNN
jgi:hypothetical protein